MNDEPVVYAGKVLEKWIDYNEHMNDACYVSVFSESIDNLMDYIGIDEKFRAFEGVSIYTLQTSVHYLKELGLGGSLAVSARLLEYDSKKLRVFLTMGDPSFAEHFATMEALLLHVDMTVRRSSPFRTKTLEKIGALFAAQREKPWPARAGEGISLQKGR
ncbi:thioesterase [Trinickia violacea]|uniref:Thioesterase n=1 Tax=Trinickia violacea TaxID=2571746 RepID=A0A4P8IMB9_9BURK|nr:thioesterase family protein [Trinickia violacea]QCP49081.1 thioesterase [Trinickia violacea]